MIAEVGTAHIILHLYDSAVMPIPQIVRIGGAKKDTTSISLAFKETNAGCSLRTSSDESSIIREDVTKWAAVHMIVSFQKGDFLSESTR